MVGARGRRYGGPFFIHPRARLFAAELGLLVVPTAMILPFALTNLEGAGFAVGGIRLGKHRGFRVLADRPLRAQVDGDYIGRATEFEVGVSEVSLAFCLPGRR